MKIELWPIDRPIPYDKNPRKITERAIEKVAASLREFGFRQPLVCEPNGTIIVGHKRLLGAKKLGLARVPVTIADDLSKAQIKAYRLADNRTADETDWDDDLLAIELGELEDMGWDLALTGFDPIEISALREPGADPAATLAERFLVAPFSVLNAREGWWQDRKAAWLALGIESELGRGGNLLKMSDTILDPDGAKGLRRPPKSNIPTSGRPFAGLEPAAELSPTQELSFRGESIWAKRDDLYSIAGAIGGKARTCIAIAAAPPSPKGLITAGSRASPQIQIVAAIAAHMGIPCRAHCPRGELGPELEAAKAAGAHIIQHAHGYNSVICARARDDAAARPGWREIPFGMEHPAAIAQTAAQCANLPPEAVRLVVPIGSGMSLAGVLWGMQHFGFGFPVLGVACGADPRKRLDKWAPKGWAGMVEIAKSPLDYHAAARAHLFAADGGGGDPILLDPHYEAKCAQFLRGGDCLWIVGVRSGASGLAARAAHDADHPPRAA